MTSRDWRSALLPALLTSAIAAYSGGLPEGPSSTQMVAFDAQVDSALSLHQSPPAELDGNSARNSVPAWTATSQGAPRHSSDTWTPSASDDNGGDSADDDDDDPDDVPTAVVGPAPPAPAADHGHMPVLSPPEVDHRSASVSDGHLLRGPPNARNTMPAWTRSPLALRHSSNKFTAVAVSDGNSGDPFDDDDDDDSDDDVVGAAVLGQAPPSLTADHGHTQLSIRPEIDRHSSFASDGHSLRAPPQ
jgi:hypothetical protein